MAQSKRDKLDKIRDTFKKLDVEISRDDIWDVQGTPVVYHKAIERLGAALKVMWDKPTIIRNERDEAVILVTGYLNAVIDNGRIGSYERMEWSIGEALVGVNYRVSGRQAAYVWAMAEKRAKDRVILKLADLHGDVYSDEEADEFKKGNQRQEPPARQPETTVTVVASVDDDPEEPAADPVGTTAQDNVNVDELTTRLKAAIDRASSINAVTDLMLHAETQKALQQIGEAKETEVRDHAKARLVALGWPTKKTA